MIYDLTMEEHILLDWLSKHAKLFRTGLVQENWIFHDLYMPISIILVPKILF